MKKFLLGFAMLLTVGSSYAQTDVTASLRFENTEIEMKPGDIEVVNVYLDCSATKAFSAAQFFVYLPEGVKLAPINYEEAVEEYEADVEAYIEDGEDPSELNLEDYFQYNKLGDFSNAGSFQVGTSFFNNKNNTGLNEYRVTIFTISTETFPARTTDKKKPLMSFGIIATDSCQTGTFPINVTNAILNKADFTPYEIEDFEAATLTYSIDYTIGDSGFGTLCWPVSLDFSKNDFKAYIGSDICSGGDGKYFMSRSQVTKVIGKTPLIIEGKPGNYSLTTTLEESLDDVSKNVLEGTPSAPLKVETNNIYALASKTPGVGFYRVNNDAEKPVIIPQYKAYYTNTGSANEFLFEETTGIDEMAIDNENAQTYTISGVKVSKANQKGVYIINGKKVVVK